MSFDALGALPVGTAILEASAGTGKTFAIETLAARFIAEGLATIDQLLLVTFSNAATSELRERTRRRLDSAARALTDPGAALKSTDELARLLAMGDSTEVNRRRIRLVQALSEFDNGTIVTTHSFCQRMLDGLGLLADQDRFTQFVEEAEDIWDQSVEDLYLARFADQADPPAFKSARTAARTALRDRQATLVRYPSDSDAGALTEFAEAARIEVEDRKRRAALTDFADQLELLAHALTDPEVGDQACARVRSRYSVVLVDEFQDTDPLQWQILETAFHGHCRLILVGDPKQAIYAFRGAEVTSYLKAADVAQAHESLGTNWRSDADLVRALAHLYGSAELGDERIVVHDVDTHHGASRISAPAFRLRYLSRMGAGPILSHGFATPDDLRVRIAKDVAADIVSQLIAGTQLRLDDARRAIEPGDIAVLTRTNKQAEFVQDALERVGVPTVLTSTNNVFGTRAAQDWLRLLRALEQPQQSSAVRLAALTSLYGLTVTELDERGEDVTARVSTQLREWSAVFAESGFAAMFDQIARATDLMVRVLRFESGERELTDLRHIAETLNAVAVRESLGIAALARWLDERVCDPASQSVDRSRRLDKDEDAVQIATIHASKGLQYPVVYVPFGWDPATLFSPDAFMFHEGDRRMLDLGGSNATGRGARLDQSRNEQAGEELRLLYVALTRAQCQVVAWWAPTSITSGGALHRLIFGRRGPSQVATSVPVPDDAAVAARFEQWALEEPSIRVEAVGSQPIPVVKWEARNRVTRDLAAARFTRELDSAWRRTSYSALTAGAHDAHATIDPDVEIKDDEPVDEPVTEAAGTLPSLFNGLPGGAFFGTIVHSILEHVDTAALDLDLEVRERCRELGGGIAGLDPDHLADALLPVLHTDIGFGSLASIRPSDRLAELDFELPLAGGNEPNSTVTVADIAQVLREELPADDVLVDYPDLLDAVGEGRLRGFLTGSIDAVLRVAGPKFVVVDYKTNRLGIGDLTIEQYSPEAMAQEMMRSHYPLQALLYCVALHRYLALRLPQYDPNTHLGGIRYLFVRGMAADQGLKGHGVFAWQPSARLITRLSTLLAGAS